MRIAPSLAVFAFFAVASGTPQAAQAAPKPAAKKAAEKAAKKACITGDFRKGVDLLGDLFVETNDATYVYNQGRCFEQNHRWEEAIDRFREYLRKAPDLPAADKVAVDNHISDCEAQQAKLTPPPAAPIAAPAPPPPPPPPQPQAPTAVTVHLVAPAVAAEQHAGSGLRTAGIVTAAVGLAALGGGLFCNLQANSLADELNRSGDNRDKASRRDTYETLGWVGYGVGAAALLTGTTLIIVGWPSGRTAEAPPAVSLTPVFLPGVAALALRGTY